MLSSMPPLPALVSILLFAQAAGAPPSRAAELRTAVLSPDGSAALAEAPGAAPGGGGGGQHWWLENLAVVDPLGELKMLLAGAKKPLRQRVNGSTPTGPIKLGTPPVTLDVIFDTGSDKLVAKTWDTVKRELKMVDRSAPDQIKPTSALYDHNRSSTYAPRYMTIRGASVRKRGYVAYGSGIAITDEGTETVTVAGHTITNFSLSEITADSLTVLHSKRGVAGVLGLQHMKNHTLGKSFYTLCRDKGTMTSFGYCRGKKNQGTFIWGDTSTEGTALPVVGQIHWAVKLADVRVHGKESKDKKDSKAAKSLKAADKLYGEAEADLYGSSRLGARGSEAADLGSRDPGFAEEWVMAKYSEDVALLENATKAKKGRGANASSADAGVEAAAELCPGGKCVSIIDTGSNIIAGPINALKLLSQKLGVKYDCSNIHQLPPISMSLGGFHVSLPSSSYIMKVKLPRLITPLKPKPVVRKLSHLELEGGEAEGELQANESEASLSEVAQRLHRHLHESYGLDLRTALGGVPLKNLLSGKTLCMPAFVPLNKLTSAGPLWVVGTPLFDKYYVRWSWPQGDPSPQIFIKDIKKAQTCQGDHEKDGGAAIGLERASSGPGLLRSEGRGGTPLAQAEEEEAERQAAPDLPEWEAEEIRFPHWARELESL